MTAVFIPLRALFPAQVPTLGRQVQRAVSMAALAAVCEVCAALDQTPELQLDPPDAGPLEQLLAALPLSQRLQKPQSEEQSRCVPSGGQCVREGSCCSCGEPMLVPGHHPPDAGWVQELGAEAPFRVASCPTLFVSVTDTHDFPHLVSSES